MVLWSLATVLLTGMTAQAANTDKTLVSWVALADRNVRGGSVLSAQSGDLYDGIVFAEIAPNRWMAGSDFYNRTQRNQNRLKEETTDGKALLQMAIVYGANRVTLYRNGEALASYEAKNVDILGQKDVIVVFGQRQVPPYGVGSIGGSIADARIYSQALTVEQLKALKPKEASDIQPWAWWDFKDEKALDRTGRFPHSRLLGGAKVVDGKLVLGPDAAMLASPRVEPVTPSWPEKPPANWLTYHLAHPGPGNAFPGDPNPILFYKGRYHLHYIYDLGGPCFGHVSSTDMVHWKWHPTVLTPRTTGHGMFSGTGFFTREGKPAMIYHGAGSGRNWIAYGLDDNLDQWSPPEPVVPRDPDGRPAAMNQWDPDCWLNGDTYYATSGGQNPHLMKSKDLKTWQHLGLLLHNQYPPTLGVPKHEDISCGNMFKIGNQWMLLCISHPLGCRYYLGDFKDEKFLPRFHAMMSWNGNNYFAPESILTPDDRRVMWAWLVGLPIAPTGVQSLPRELELASDGSLRIRPLRELQKLRHGEKTVAAGRLAGDRPGDSAFQGTRLLNEASGDAMELEVKFQPSTAKTFGLDVLCDAKGANGMRIAVDRQRNLLRVGKVNAPFELRPGEPLTLRVFVDKNLVEVFVNDRQAAVAAAAYVPGNLHTRLFSDGGDAEVISATVWQMKM